MSRKRLSKKQLKRDRFVEQTFDWAHWAETHRNQVLAGVVGVALLVAAFFVYRNMARDAEAQAARDYISARQSYFAGNYPLAVSDLRRFLDEHGRSSYADDAEFFLADAYHEAGDDAQAIAALEKFLDDHGKSPFAGAARRLLAAVYQSAGQYDKAVETYREAIDAAGYDELKAQLHHELAEVYEAQGKPAQAVDEYRAVVELEPDGDAAQEARRRIAEITVQPIAVGGPEVAPSEGP